MSCRYRGFAGGFLLAALVFSFGAQAQHQGHGGKPALPFVDPKTTITATLQSPSAASCGGGTSVQRPRIEPAWLQDPPSLHGMVLLGRGPYYLSHLPMFMRPHDYQAIFEVELAGPGAAALANRPAGSLLTISPESFVLPRKAQECGAFQADVFDGHFERGGQQVTTGTQFRIVRTVYFRKFTPSDSRPAHPRRILFGDRNQQFLAHEIVSPPDFDQLTPVRVTDTRILDALGGRSYLTVDSEGPNQPLSAAGEVRGRIPTHPDLGTLPIGDAAASVYTEHGDLAH